MNRQRRAAIAALSLRLQDMVGQIETLRSDMETIRDEEQDAKDALPESMADGDRAERMQEAIDKLDEAINELEAFDPSAISDLLEEASA